MAHPGTIVLLHGIVDAFDSARPLVDRTMVERHAFERYLGAAAPFGTWDALPDGHVRILTIDDATRAGAEACRVAVKLGHQVTFFVNPKNIETRESYFFTLLSAAIDATRRSAVTHRGVAHPLTDRSLRLAFRRAMKAALLERRSDAEIRSELTQIIDVLDVADVAVPDHHQPITLNELLELRDLGVRIENHGWDHIEIAALSESAFREHVTRGRDWLRAHLDVAADSYATPFGMTFLPQFAHRVAGAWFLARRDLPAGRLAERCWNRVEISEDVQFASK